MAQMHDPKQIRTFMLAGRAVVTFVSKVSGQHLTFRLWKKDEPDSPVFVGALTGPSNTRDFTFLGTIFSDGVYRHSARSRIRPDAKSAMAFAWVWKYISAGKMPTKVDVFHEGRCGRCGRRLTVPESITTGIGPECIKYLS